MAESLREISRENSRVKITPIIEQFKREVKKASVNGLTKIDFIIIHKEHFEYMNDEVVEEFKKFLDENGFILYDEKLIEEKDVMVDKFNYFNIGW